MRGMEISADTLRHAGLCRILHALATGQVSAEALTGAYLDAIARENEARKAFVFVAPEAALSEARASDQRRAEGRPLGRLDGLPLAIKDNIDVAGMPTGLGLAGEARPACRDAFVVERLRGAGALVLGKTTLDEAAMGTLGRNPLVGDVPNPAVPGRVAGGSSAGSAVAVASGLCAAALGSDTMGSVRIPAAFCGVVGHRPTVGELSASGLASALRRVDCVGVLTRNVACAAPLLQVMAGYDPEDPRSRRRRVPLAPPDWQADRIRVGVVADLDSLGVDRVAAQHFGTAVGRVSGLFRQSTPLELDVAALEIAAARRAALLLMEAEILAAHDSALAAASPGLLGLLNFAKRCSAVDYARAARRLDALVVQVRRLFERFDVLLLPTVPMAPPLLGSEEPGNLADLTALASLGGCPALSLPLGEGHGLQLVGAPGSDLRLLELGEVMEAVIGAEAASAAA